MQLFGTDWTSAATLGHSRFRVAFWGVSRSAGASGKVLGGVSWGASWVVVWQPELRGKRGGARHGECRGSGFRV